MELTQLRQLCQQIGTISRCCWGCRGWGSCRHRGECGLFLRGGSGLLLLEGGGFLLRDSVLVLAACNGTAHGGCCASNHGGTGYGSEKAGASGASNERHVSP